MRSLVVCGVVALFVDACASAPVVAPVEEPVVVVPGLDVGDALARVQENVPSAVALRFVALDDDTAAVARFELGRVHRGRNGGFARFHLPSEGWVLRDLAFAIDGVIVGSDVAAEEARLMIAQQPRAFGTLVRIARRPEPPRYVLLYADHGDCFVVVDARVVDGHVVTGAVDHDCLDVMAGAD